MIALLLLCLSIGGVHAIVIGNNAAPAGSSLAPLHYADDDAALMHEWLTGAGAEVSLLSVLDARSQERFPAARDLARTPTRANLDAAVATVAKRLESDHDGVVFLFFSGHGRDGALTLFDGALTQSDLYVLLAALPSRYVHVIVDACDAEAVVRPRGDDREIVSLSAAEREHLQRAHTLARFPHVGAVLASASQHNTHEWTRYEQGVLTHEILSGLRGAADADHDGRVEYGELQAFLSAANRGIKDPRAKLTVIAHPPPLNHRAPLADTGWLTHTAWLSGDAAELQHFWIEDERGVRLLDAHQEHGASLRLAVPATTKLFVHGPRGEALLSLAPGEERTFTTLAWQPTSLFDRGALDDALLAGAFAEPFGATYYRGFVDASLHVVTSAAARPARTPSIALWTAGGAAGVASAVLGAVSASAHDTYTRTDLQRPAALAEQRADATLVAALVSGALAVGFGAAGLALFPWRF